MWVWAYVGMGLSIVHAPIIIQTISYMYTCPEMWQYLRKGITARQYLKI